MDKEAFRKDDPIRYAQEIIGRDPFSTLLGIRVEEVREEYARASLTIRDDYCNAEARSHGGVLFSLADQTFSVACHTRGHVTFALELKINYFEAARAGDVITAEAVPIDIRKRVSLWNIELTNQDRRKIALAQALAYHVI
jgi:acyl-CoA thioesterase